MKTPAPIKNQKSKIKNQIFLFVLLLTSYFLLLTSPASAQSQTNPYTVPNTNPDVPRNLHTWTQNVMIEVMSAMSCQLTGIDPINPKHQCLGVDTKTGKIGYVEGGGGAIGVTGKMIAMLYTPPLRTADYFRYLASNFGIAKKAYAATGFQGLQPVQSLWVAFRNIVYLFMVVVFVIIGLAIMLRVRIDPRTVMTIQNQIPRIIIGLLLVTFSFAIAGFLIDLMYTTIFLSYELISKAVTPPDLLKDLNPLLLQKATPFTLAGAIKTGGIFGIASDAADALHSIIKSLFASLLGTIPTPALTALVGGLVGTLFTPGLGSLLGGVLGALVGFIPGANIATEKVVSNLLADLAFPIAFLIVAAALLFVLIRLWFTLLVSYVAILLDVVFAPFWVVGALLPGSPIGFTAWLRSIISNLAVFPAVILMFLLAKVFIDGIGKCTLPTCDPKTVFVPPLVGSLPGTNAIGALIALGIIFMTPGVVNMIKGAIKAPGVPGIGLFGVAIGAGTSPYMAGARAAGASIAKTPELGKRGGLTGAARQIFRF